MSTLFNADELKVSNTVIKYCKKCDEQKPHFVIRFWSKEKGRYRINRQCVDCKRRKDRLFGQKEDRKKSNKEALKRFYESEKGKLRRQQREEYKANKIIGKVCQIHLFECSNCKKSFTLRKPNKYGNICGMCSRSINNQKPKSKKHCVCGNCGVTYTGAHSNALCVHCASKRQMAYRNIASKKRKALIRGASIAEPVVDKKVFDRDKWRCYLCNIKVQKNDIYANDAAEIDHIVPVSKGGVHTYSNVRCICRRCNGSTGKSNKLIGQIVLQL